MSNLQKISPVHTKQACFIDRYPEKRGSEKGQYKSEQLSKERLSVLLCCSGAREKSKPLVTGNASQCRVFKEQHINTAHPPPPR
jgi:hypothetical protein